MINPRFVGQGPSRSSKQEFLQLFIYYPRKTVYITGAIKKLYEYYCIFSVILKMCLKTDFLRQLKLLSVIHVIT